MVCRWLDGVGSVALLHLTLHALQALVFWVDWIEKRFGVDRWEGMHNYSSLTLMFLDGVLAA